MQVQFGYGNEDYLLQQHPITPGSLYVTTDTHRIYFDSEEGKRILVSDMQALTIEELDAILV